MTTADPGSFRDPMSRVFIDDDRIRRGLDGEALEDWEAFAASALFERASHDGRIVPTTRLDDAPSGDATAVASGAPGGRSFAATLEHERIPFVSYPYEWSFEMLRDAALVQLGLLREALDEDLTMKDASSYNVQFVGARPTFIDIGSFERLRDGEPWYGYRQFCQLFLFPLMIQAYRDLPFQPWLRSAIDGITPIEARHAMCRRDYRRKGAFVHVYLHARLEERFADTERDVKSEMRAGFKKELIVNNVNKLTQVVEGLRWKRSESTWSDYSERAHYTDDDLRLKGEFVSAAVGARPRSLVWDLGANDGYFSRLAAETGAYVVAADADPLVVDTLYRTLRDEGNESILPVVIDLANPSPGTGWRSRERQPFVGRARPDLVLCLAVIHHLAISNNVPIQEFVRFLADIGAEAVLEFPHPDDPMVERLRRNKRAGVHDDYARPAVEAEIDQHFDVVSRKELPGGTRTLYHLAPKPG